AHEVYDTETNTWSKAAPIPVVHDGTAGVAVNEKIYAFQGDRTFEFDPGGNMWTEKAKMSNIARWSYGAVALDDRIFVIGGLLAGSSNATDICEEYDPVADRWHTRPSMLNGRGLLALGAINGGIFAATGYDFLGVGYPLTTEEFTPPTSYFLYSKD
ncbi:MAG: hypothetical protein HUU16_11065, partial [Candidatus Omnitrophica bacterium]|nr:hypothetical protein [Candidatus Omnitrophota bacterium]